MGECDRLSKKNGPTSSSSTELNQAFEHVTSMPATSCHAEKARERSAEIRMWPEQKSFAVHLTKRRSSFQKWRALCSNGLILQWAMRQVKSVRRAERGFARNFQRRVGIVLPLTDRINAIHQY
jgi:hypothetical protein